MESNRSGNMSKIILGRNKENDIGGSSIFYIHIPMILQDGTNHILSCHTILVYSIAWYKSDTTINPIYDVLTDKII